MKRDTAFVRSARGKHAYRLPYSTGYWLLLGWAALSLICHVVGCDLLAPPDVTGIWDAQMTMQFPDAPVWDYAGDLTMYLVQDGASVTGTIVIAEGDPDLETLLDIDMGLLDGMDLYVSASRSDDKQLAMIFRGHVASESMGGAVTAHHSGADIDGSGTWSAHKQ
jgi:hypothetical protein